MKSNIQYLCGAKGWSSVLMDQMTSSERNKLVKETKTWKQAKVAIGRWSQGWTHPFCGHMTNLEKIQGSGGSEIWSWENMQKAKRGEKKKRGRGVSAASVHCLQSVMENVNREWNISDRLCVCLQGLYFWNYMQSHFKDYLHDELQFTVHSAVSWV